MAVVATADGGVLAWTGYETDGWALRASRLGADATALDPAGILVADGVRVAYSGPALSQLEGGVLIAYAIDDPPGGDTKGRVLTAGGGVGPELALTTAPGGEVPTSVGGAPPLLVGQAGTYAANTGESAFVLPLTEAGVPSGPQRVLATSAQEQGAPSIARSEDGWVTAWMERTEDTGWDIRVGRADPSGDAQDGVGRVAASEAGDQREPAVAWNGTNGVVVWRDEPTGGRIYARAVDSDGTVVGSRLLVGEGAGIGTSPRIASDGAGFLVVWLQPDDDNQDSPIRAQRLGPDGARIGGALELSATARGTPDVAWVGAAYLAIWTGNGPTGSRIMGRRVLASGSIADAAAFRISSDAPGSFAEAPTVGSGPDQALVAWRDGATGGVVGRRVDPAGTVLDAEDRMLSGTSAIWSRATVAWNGRTYLAGWYGLSDGLRFEATEVSRDGAVVGTRARVMADGVTVPIWHPQLAGGRDGRAALVFERNVGGHPIGGIRRAHVRTIDLARPGVAAASIAIADGAPATRSTQVAVGVPAQHATHVALSNDGVSWFTQPYVPHVDWSLTAPAYGGSSADGTKQVHVRWRDAAGTWTSIQVDTIVLDRVGPTSTTPSAAFVSGTSVRSSSVTLRLRWSGADSRSGIAGYDIARSRDGGAWSLVATGVPTVSAERVVSASGTWRFRVRAVDRAGNIGAWMSGPTLAPRGASEGAAAVSYVGRWSRSTHVDAWGGAVRSATTAGKSATYRFTGQAFAWVATVGPGRGAARIYVDGSFVKTIDLYRATTARRQIVFVRHWTKAAAHRVRIVVIGTSGRPRVDIDGFLRW